MSHPRHGVRAHLVLIPLLACGCVFGQVRLPIEEGIDLKFVPVPFGDGSSHATVTRIVEDRSGFLWFGTTDGLKRYDGYRFREFRPESGNRNSLSGLSVRTVLKDRSGNLWVASDLTVDRYDPAKETFTQFRSDPSTLEGPVHDINEDAAGMIWLATGKGLTRIDPASQRKTRYLSQMIGTLRSTLEGKDGTFWVASKESVGVFDRATGEITERFALRDAAAARTGGSANHIVGLFQDHAGVIWVASDRDGLARVDRKNRKLTHFALAAGSDPAHEPGVRALHEDRDGTLWIGTSGGIFKLDRERTKFVRYRNAPDDSDSLSADRVLALFEDHEGAMWVGMDGGGVDRFAMRPSFLRYRREPGGSLSSEYVSSAYQDSRDNVWLGSKGSVYRIDGKTGQRSAHLLGGMQGGLANADVFSIVEDRSGTLWFGAWGGGVHRFDPKTKKWKIYRHTGDPTSLGHDSVFALLVDHKGRLWLGTEDGLDLFDAKTERFQIFRAAELGVNRERAIAKDSSGALWLATLYTGVHRFDPATGQFTFYRHSEAEGSLSNDAVAAIFVDHSGAVWAGTANGLNRLDPANGRITAYYESDGLAGNSVNGIQEDERGNLWVTTNKGLSRFDRAGNTFENYYACDGVPSDLTSIWKGRAGQMFLGSHSGLFSFRPDRVAVARYVPPVVLTSFELSDMPAPIGGDSPLKQSISLTESLTLSHKQRIFSFEFAALAYASPSQTRYRYKLEGLETGWNEADASQRSVRYTTVAAGDYTFRVQSRTNRGEWSEKGAQVHIRILPPWWDTWPARTAFALAFCLALWAAYRLRVSQVAGRLNIRFEERLMERTRIAGELHDTLLQGFLSASMQLDVAADRVPPDSPVKPQLNHILELMSRVSAEGRKALQGLRSSEGDSMRLEQAFVQIEQEFGGQGPPPDFSVAVEGRSRPLHPVFRDEAYRIGREAVINAFRHSGARTVEVLIEYSSRHFRLVVQDDGRGIDPQVLRAGREGHWGLPGMRERAERIGAQLRVWSRRERGTSVEMSVPGHIAFRSSPTPGRVKKPFWPRVNTQKVLRQDSEQR